MAAGCATCARPRTTRSVSAYRWSSKLRASSTMGFAPAQLLPRWLEVCLQCCSPQVAGSVAGVTSAPYLVGVLGSEIRPLFADYTELRQCANANGIERVSRANFMERATSALVNAPVQITDEYVSPDRSQSKGRFVLIYCVAAFGRPLPSMPPASLDPKAAFVVRKSSHSPSSDSGRSRRRSDSLRPINRALLKG